MSATTWWLVRIQPFESKITPEPMPDVAVASFGSVPAVTIRTTAGPTLAAALIVADCSSTVTGWVTLVPLLVVASDGGAGRSRAPEARSAA